VRDDRLLLSDNIDAIERIEKRTAHAEVPWSLIVGMRNILVHAYFGVDNEEVWSAVQNDLPKLKSQVLKIRDALSPGDRPE
jgi:uncharacterized protein with HEPN domain